MNRQALTLNIEQELLEEAHAVAMRRHTSVTERVRQFLKQVVRQERQRMEAWHDVQKLMEKPRARLGTGAPSRVRGASLRSGSEANRRMLALLQAWRAEPLTADEELLLDDFDEFQARHPLRFTRLSS